MQSYLWMRPALQISEAVLLPALPRRSILSDPRFWDRFPNITTSGNPFRPVPEDDVTNDNMALSTFVRERGSMAGRGVLRAVGIRLDPYAAQRPAYAGRGRRMLLTRRCRVR